jgi:hypothetical protein
MNTVETVNLNGKQASNKPATPKNPAVQQADYVWLDGEFVPFEKSTVHVLSPSLHYGLGVFEGIRCYATERGTAALLCPAHDVF